MTPSGLALSQIEALLRSHHDPHFIMKDKESRALVEFGLVTIAESLDGQRYVPTSRGEKLILMIRELPLPIQAWIDPRKDSNDR